MNRCIQESYTKTEDKLKPRHNERQETDRFVRYITRFRFMEILFHIFYYNCRKENR